DFIADSSQSRGWLENVVAYIPTIQSDVQAGDNSVKAAALSNHTLGIFTTNSNASVLLQLLGQMSILPTQHAAQVTVSLVRTLNPGEFIVAVDLNTMQHETAGTIVRNPRPEVIATDRVAYSAGQTGFVSGRNFGTSPQVIISGQPVPTTPINANTCAFIAPSIDNSPTNLFVLEIMNGALLSNIMGVQLIPSCGTCRGNVNADARSR